jgi:hypothetical protein
MNFVDLEFDERSPGPQKLEIADTPPDTTMILEGHEGHGSGRVTIDFGRLVARGEQQCERHGRIKIERPGETLRLRKAFRLSYKFGPPSARP